MKETGKPNRNPKVIMIRYGSDDGGSAYESMVAESLAGHCDLLRSRLDFRRWGKLKYVAAPLEIGVACYRLFRNSGCDLAIKTFAASLQNTWGPPHTVVIFFHAGASRNMLFSALEGSLLKKLQKVDAVVVEAEHWAQFLRERGLRNVIKIYNAFPVEEFRFEPFEIDAFREKYGLAGKPIIYLGNYHHGKGTLQAFEALRGLDVHFVASGLPEPPHEPIKCAYFTRREYLQLLKSATLVVTMSQFAEGWCRTAHEAMLCGTPVLGSGRGGMRELLTCGNQVLCEDFNVLRSEAKTLLADENRRRDMGQSGYDYAKEFTYQRFQAEWVQLVDQVVAH